ncbi:transposase [Streptomyces sp. NPDC016626]|uniref:transposase n=1 Tax=Streptomyces sp. NPDC016626 TaxID=3364968 RepID=UPI0036F769B2
MSRDRPGEPCDSTPASPRSRQARRHRSTDRSLTRKATATSRFVSPPSKRTTACNRTRSRAALSASVSPPPCAYLTPQSYRSQQAADLKKFAEARNWLTIYYLPSYAPDLNPVEGIWSLLRRGWLSNVAFSTPEHLVQRIRRGLRHIQYRSHLIDGCLAETGLTIRPA